MSRQAMEDEDTKIMIIRKTTDKCPQENYKTTHKNLRERKIHCANNPPLVKDMSAILYCK